MFTSMFPTTIEVFVYTHTCTVYTISLNASTAPVWPFNAKRFTHLNCDNMKKSEMNRETEKMSVKHESIQSFTNTSIPKNGDVDNDKQNKQAKLKWFLPRKKNIIVTRIHHLITYFQAYYNGLPEEVIKHKMFKYVRVVRDPSVYVKLEYRMNGTEKNE